LGRGVFGSRRGVEAECPDAHSFIHTDGDSASVLTTL